MIESAKLMQIIGCMNESMRQIMEAKSIDEMREANRYLRVYSLELEKLTKPE